jgi:hypothetical protein
MRHVFDPAREAPDRVRVALNGAVRISTDGTTTLNGEVMQSCVYFAAKTASTLTLDGATTLEIEDGLSLSDLSVEELEEVVSWAGVSTEAQTSTGLRRAIERHFEP